MPRAARTTALPGWRANRPSPAAPPSNPAPPTPPAPPPGVQPKLIKPFADAPATRADPAHADTRRWRPAQTTRPLGRSHLWDADLRLGVCGDWCRGHRLEDAFVSGLELARAVA